MADTPTIGIATWNIHMGIGSDGRRDLDRIAEVILALDVDCIALQEVDNRFVAGRLGELTTLARKTGYEAFSGPTMHRSDGNYGNAVLTRLPVLQVRLKELSIGEFEPRGLIDIELQCGDAAVLITATHLGLRSAERRRQIDQILLHLQAFSERPNILLGDFNEWCPWSRNLRRLRAPFRKTSAPSSFPAPCPLLALDRIFVSPQLRILSQHVARGTIARKASDHLPLRAVIELPA